MVMSLTFGSLLVSLSRTHTSNAEHHPVELGVRSCLKILNETPNWVTIPVSNLNDRNKVLLSLWRLKNVPNRTLRDSFELFLKSESIREGSDGSFNRMSTVFLANRLLYKSESLSKNYTKEIISSQERMLAYGHNLPTSWPLTVSEKSSIALTGMSFGMFSIYPNCLADFDILSKHCRKRRKMSLLRAIHAN